MWLVFALLSAVFAAATSVLAKVGIEQMNSNLATAIRTAVVLVMAWIFVFATHGQRELPSVSGKSWLFLILSGAATGASWLCYYKALQAGQVSKVAAVDKLSIVLTIGFACLFLGEHLTVKTAAGALLIAVGTVLAAM